MLHRLLVSLGAAAGLCGLGIAPAARAQSLSPEAAPAEWVRYAQAATSSVQGWLEADNEIAGRVRAYLDATRPSPDQPTAPLVLKLWVDADGAISRIDYPRFAHAQANTDFHNLIVGKRLTGKPPRNMLLPMRILLQLRPPPVST